MLRVSNRYGCGGKRRNDERGLGTHDSAHDSAGQLSNY
jgi:hypothetical protein